MAPNLQENPLGAGGNKAAPDAFSSSAVLPFRMNPRRPELRAPLAALLALLALVRPRPARAEDSAMYLFQDYQESSGRIGVKSSTAQIDQDIGTDLHLSLGGVTDTIVGATPTGQPAPAGRDQVILSELHDYRKAWNGQFSDQIAHTNVGVGFSRSLEHDYVSNGYSLNTVTDFNQKNTTLLLGVAATDNNVQVTFEPAWFRKHTADGIVGVTQLLDPHTSVTFDFTFDRSTGYLSEPYKLVQDDIQVLPGLFVPHTYGENRPWIRDKGIALLSVTHDFASLHGALEASYRFYADTYGIVGHTLDLAWYQHIGDKVIVRPGLRGYQQSAADFYYYNLDATSIVPVAIPNPTSPHYSSDARLSALESFDASLKVIWTVTAWLQVEGGVESYRNRGTDGVTPQSAYYRAAISSVGAKFSW